MGSAQGLIDVARGYLGTTEDDPRFAELIEFYNANTDGYDMSFWDEWCACFVSVCSIKSGNANATGTSVNCNEFRRIWREKGIYRERWETPAPGWLIDYDWEQDGVPDHIGIVVDCDGSTIHVIEGNTDGERCAEHWIPVGSGSISCFGAPDYQGNGDDMYPVNMPEKGAPVFRLHNANSGEHFYTVSEGERDACVANGWTYEGVAWNCPAPEVPIYRMYAPGGFHHFTAGYDEAAFLAKHGWVCELVPFFGASSGASVYRLYNPNNSDHLFTLSEGERDACISRGWTYEGVAFYV